MKPPIEVPSNGPGSTVAVIQQRDPQIQPFVMSRLRSLGTGRREAGLRGDDPTPDEAAQIAHDHAFRKAYGQAPVETLMLLRWVNEQLRQK